MQASYLNAMDQVGTRRRSAETALGMALKRRLCPKLEIMMIRATKTDSYSNEATRKRIKFYRFPTLDECRAEFDQLIGWEVPWDEM